MWVLYLITPWEKNKANGAAAGQNSGWLAFFHLLAFLCKEFRFWGCCHVVCPKPKVFPGAWDNQETQLGQGTAEAEPTLCVAAGALTDTVLPQVMPGTGSSTDLTAHTGTLGTPNGSQAGPPSHRSWEPSLALGDAQWQSWTARAEGFRCHFYSTLILCRKGNQLIELLFHISNLN